MPEFKDLTGKRFGKLTVIKIHPIRKNKRVYWECMCDCGKVIFTSGCNLVNGGSKSCGCSFIDKRTVSNYNVDGKRERLYGTWAGMKHRCKSQKTVRAKHYLGKGIIVCKEWSNDYLKFRDWAMNNGYKEGLTIDRIDNDGNYCPENCRWVTIRENNNNRHNGLHIIIDGIDDSIIGWSKRLNLSYSSLISISSRNGHEYLTLYIESKLKGKPVPICANKKISHKIYSNKRT